MTQTSKPQVQPEPRWTKLELLQASNANGARRDVLNVALEDGKKYTTAEVKAAVDKFKGGLF